MSISFSIDMESVCRKVGDFIVYFSNVAIILTSHIRCEPNSLTFQEVGHIGCILSVDEEGCGSNTVVLLLPQECDLHHRWLFLPMKSSFILMEDPPGGSLIGWNALMDTISDIGTDDISFQIDKEGSWIVRIVFFRQLEPSGPDLQRIHIHNLKPEVERAHQ